MTAIMASVPLKDAKSIQNNLGRPLMSPEAMKPIDGKPFDGQISCLTTDAFLELFVQPSASGDIQTVNAKLDTDMDGKYDWWWTPQVTISGVCGNGVIQCDPGTWNNCHGYAWTATASNQLALSSVTLPELGGCYCVNNHCGNNLVWNNLNSVLTDLGGGAASALAKANPYYAITNVTTSATTVQYYGQNTQSCSTSPPPNMTNYAAQPSQMSNAAFAQSTTDPIYTTVKNSLAATLEDTRLYSCDVRRTISMNETTINDVIEYNSGNGKVSQSGPNSLEIRLGTIGDNYWGGNCQLHSEFASFDILQPQRILSAKLMHVKWDDYVQFIVDSALVWQGPIVWDGTNSPPSPRHRDCDGERDWNKTGIDQDFMQHMKQVGTVNFELRTLVGGRGEGYAFATIEVDTSCYLNPDAIVNQCGGYENNPDCNLEEEKVDGVVTYQHSAPTGLTPLTQTQQLVGGACTIAATRNWFEKNRRYRCKGNKRYDVTDALDRQNYVANSATRTAYQDKRTDPATGQVTYSSASMNILDEVKVEPCQQLCKTKKPRLANDVARSGPVKNLQVDTTTYDFFYHQCLFGCPMGQGEILVKPCGCVNEFAEAAAMMQTVRMAGGDTVCTSGIAVPP